MVFASEVTQEGTGASAPKKQDTTKSQSTTSSEWDKWSPLAADKDRELDTELNKKAGIILGVIRAIGMVVSVIILMILGIKQMTASIEEKSIIKQAMPGYILGAIMVFAITWLPSLIYNISKGWFK